MATTTLSNKHTEKFGPSNWAYWLASIVIVIALVAYFTTRTYTNQDPSKLSVPSATEGASGAGAPGPATTAEGR